MLRNPGNHVPTTCGTSVLLNITKIDSMDSVSTQHRHDRSCRYTSFTRQPDRQSDSPAASQAVRVLLRRCVVRCLFE